MKMMSDSELKSICYAVLASNVGDIETERFVALVNRDAFDYTEWRREHLCQGETVDSLYAKICDFSKVRANSSSAGGLVRPSLA